MCFIKNVLIVLVTAISVAYINDYVKIPSHTDWQQMANIYNAKSLREDNIFIAPCWIKQWAMDWARFGLQVPIEEEELFDADFNQNIRIWLIDYDDYYFRCYKQIQIKYELVAYYRTSKIFAYVLVPRSTI